GRHHQPGLRGGDGPRAAEQPCDRVHGAGVDQPGDDDVQHADRREARIGEAGERVGRGQHAADDQDGQGRGEDQVRRDPGQRERGDRCGHDRDSEPGSEIQPTVSAPSGGKGGGLYGPEAAYTARKRRVCIDVAGDVASEPGSARRPRSNPAPAGLVGPAAWSRAGLSGYAVRMTSHLEERPRARSLQPLRALVPFLRPYRQVLAAAIAALVIAAGAQLALPVALRLLIDQGLAVADAATIDRYFAALFGVAVLFGVFASLRFYL